MSTRPPTGRAVEITYRDGRTAHVVLQAVHRVRLDGEADELLFYLPGRAASWFESLSDSSVDAIIDAGRELNLPAEALAFLNGGPPPASVQAVMQDKGLMDLAQEIIRTNPGRAKRIADGTASISKG